MGRTSEKLAFEPQFGQFRPYGTAVEPPPLPTPPLRNNDQIVQSVSKIADPGKVMRRVPDRTPGMLVIEATDTGLQCLVSLLDHAELTCVFVKLNHDPDITRTKAFMTRALERFGQAKPNLPRPFFVGLHDVAPERRDAVQSGLVMRGIGGFERGTAETFARRFGASLVTLPCPDEPAAKRRAARSTKTAIAGKTWTRRVDAQEASRRR
jgi:hypothetical protein